MHHRVLGLLRDAWYLVILIFVSAAALWFVIDPLVGIAIVVCGLLTFVYFGVVRYDSDGHERKDAG